MNLNEIIEYLASPNDLSSAMASLELEFIKQNQDRYAEGIIVPFPFPTGIGKTFASTSVMAIIAATNHKLREDGEFLTSEYTEDVKLASRTLFTCPSRKLVEEGYQGIIQKYEDLRRKKLINKKEHTTLLSRTIKMDRKAVVAQRFYVKKTRWLPSLHDLVYTLIPHHRFTKNTPKSSNARAH